MKAIPHTHNSIKRFVDSVEPDGTFHSLFAYPPLCSAYSMGFFSSQCSRDAPPGTNSICSETNICGHFPGEITVISCGPSTLSHVGPYVTDNIKALRRWRLLSGRFSPAAEGSQPLRVQAYRTCPLPSVRGIIPSITGEGSWRSAPHQQRPIKAIRQHPGSRRRSSAPAPAAGRRASATSSLRLRLRLRPRAAFPSLVCINGPVLEP